MHGVNLEEIEACGPAKSPSVRFAPLSRIPEPGDLITSFSTEPRRRFCHFTVVTNKRSDTSLSPTRSRQASGHEAGIGHFTTLFAAEKLAVVPVNWMY